MLKRQGCVQEVALAYHAFWDAEAGRGLRADLILAMELRDAYFLWRAAHSATIYYTALIFLQDEVPSASISFFSRGSGVCIVLARL